MKRERGSSNLVPIIIRNLSDTYPILMIRNGTYRYKCGTKRCDMCLTEKKIITLAHSKVL